MLQNYIFDLPKLSKGKGWFLRQNNLEDEFKQCECIILVIIASGSTHLTAKSTSSELTSNDR